MYRIACADSKMCKESFSMKIRLFYACLCQIVIKTWVGVQQKTVMVNGLVVKMQRWLRRAVLLLILIKYFSNTAQAQHLVGALGHLLTSCQGCPASAQQAAHRVRAQQRHLLSPVRLPAPPVPHKWARGASHQVGKNIKTMASQDLESSGSIPSFLSVQDWAMRSFSKQKIIGRKAWLPKGSRQRRPFSMRPL